MAAGARIRRQLPESNNQLIETGKKTPEINNRKKKSYKCRQTAESEAIAPRWSRLHYSAMRENLPELQRLEQELTDAVAGFRLLNALAWPLPVGEKFLASWRSGKPVLPRPRYALPGDLDGMMRVVDSVMLRAPRDHPVGQLIRRPAWSYLTAARMLASVGTPRFTERSIELYGRPDRTRVTQEWSGLDAAEFLLDKTSEMLESCVVPDVVQSMSAEDLAAALHAKIVPLFCGRPDRYPGDARTGLAAAASCGRVRLRQGVRFSPLDLDRG